MTHALTVRKIGNSLGIIITKEIAEHLHVTEGDQLYPVHTKDGIRFTPYDPDFASVMESNREYMRRHRNALSELAK